MDAKETKIFPMKVVFKVKTRKRHYENPPVLSKTYKFSKVKPVLNSVAKVTRSALSSCQQRYSSKAQSPIMVQERFFSTHLENLLITKESNSPNTVISSVNLVKRCRTPVNNQFRGFSAQSSMFPFSHTRHSDDSTPISRRSRNERLLFI